MESSDQPKLLLDGTPLLKFEDAVRFFTTVTPTGKCAGCGTDHWEIPFVSDETQRCILLSSGLSRNGVNLYVLNITCKQCGLVRMHHTEIIFNWLKSNPVEETGEPSA